MKHQLFTAVAATSLLGLVCGCSKSKQTAPQTPTSVTVASPTEEPVAEFIDLTGTMSASRTVDLVARVSGYLRSADFEDGAIVEAGQQLFLIEPEPYEQQLALAKAALLRAQSEYDRQVELLKENATSAATVERWLSERDQAAAQVEIAKLNLSYTRVTAPFKGRIGRRLVDPGNLVGPTVNTKLATLEQVAPIYVNFNLNERDALNISALMRQRGVEAKSRPAQVPIRVGLQNQEGYPFEAILDFVDTGFNPTSGTVQMRATLKNEPRAFLPGLFARVRVPLSDLRPMLVVPNSAISNDQEGDYVLVVDSGDLVARRTVVKGPLTPKGCAIRSGLTAADRVIINGQMKTRPGAKVTPVTAGSEPRTAQTNSAGV